MATTTLYLTSCDFSAWCNGGEDYATMSDYDRSMKGQFSGAGLNLTQYRITAIGIYGDYKRGTSLTAPLGNTTRGATLYNGSSISNIGSAVSSQKDGNSKMSGAYAGFTNYYTTDTSIINQLINQINSGLCVTIDLHADNRGSAFNYKFYGKNIRLVVTYEENPKYTLTVSSNNTSYGTVTGGGSYTTGTTATLAATPKVGYKFLNWSDGNNSATRTVTVTSNATYTAQFRPIYITYDSVFSFKMWADTGLASTSLIEIVNKTDTGFTGKAISTDTQTSTTPVIDISGFTRWTFKCDTSSSDFEIFLFNCDASGAWNDFNYTTYISEITINNVKGFTSIRCDILDDKASGKEVTFSNFRLYPADYPYMANSVTAEERTGRGGQAMPTPTRAGYTFKGWNTKVDGTGTTYTASNLPNDDIILFSQWEKSENQIRINHNFVGENECTGVYVQPSTKTIIFQTELASVNNNGVGADTVDGWHIRIYSSYDDIFKDLKANGLYEVVAVYKNGELIY